MAKQKVQVDYLLTGNGAIRRPARFIGTRADCYAVMKNARDSGYKVEDIRYTTIGKAL